VTGDSLLAAIFAEPQVDEHRRVYADWLCERGDPRGEFILLQLSEREGLASEATRERARSLMRGRVKAWLGPLDHVLDRKRVVFERGFPARASCKPGLRKPERFFDEPSWATFEHLDDPPLALLRASSLSSLHSLSLHRDQARLLLRQTESLPNIDTFEVRESKSRGAVIFFDERLLYSRLTKLETLRFMHFQVGLPGTWLEFLQGRLRNQEIHGDHRMRVGPAGVWAQWLRGSGTTLESVTLGDPDLAVTLGHVEVGDWARATLRPLAVSPSDDRVQAELDNLAKVGITQVLIEPQ
jgi:uncharacterized protein (TIGR02996 family)